MRTRTLVFSFFLFLFLCVGFALITFPASLAWQLVEKHIQLPKNLQINTVSGKVWDGNVLGEVVVPEMGIRRKVLLDWRLSLRRLFLGKVSILVHTRTAGVEMVSFVTQGISGSEVTIESATIDLAKFNDIAQRQRVTLSGEVTVEALGIQLESQKIAGASGRLRWSGGEIAYPVGSEQHAPILPPFAGQLTSADGNLAVGIRDDQAAFDVISVSVNAQGWMQTAVKKRLVDLAGEPWRESVPETQTVFSIKRKLF